jgi:hypothetical protein
MIRQQKVQKPSLFALTQICSMLFLPDFFEKKKSANFLFFEVFDEVSGRRLECNDSCGGRHLEEDEMDEHQDFHMFGCDMECAGDPGHCDYMTSTNEWMFHARYVDYRPDWCHLPPPEDEMFMPVFDKYGMHIYHYGEFPYYPDSLPEGSDIVNIPALKKSADGREKVEGNT